MTARMTRAVVFAYHNVGVRCLRVLLRARRRRRARRHARRRPGRDASGSSASPTSRPSSASPWIAPADSNAPDVVARVAALAPDFLFCFYYRHMLPAALLALRARAARSTCTARCCRSTAAARRSTGRCCTASAETGATLHDMAAKPDAGDIVAQQAVPILPDDTAREVFDKVTVAAEIVLDAALPALIAGTAPRMPQRPCARQLLRRPHARGRPHRLAQAGARDPQPGARRRAALSRRVHDRRRRAGARAARRACSMRRAAAARGARRRRRRSSRAAAAAARWRIACSSRRPAADARVDRAASRGDRARPRTLRRAPQRIALRDRAHRCVARRSPCRTRSTARATPHEKSPDPRRQRLHRPHLSQAHPRDDRLGRLRHGHADRAHRRPARPSRASISSKATSRSTRSGSSTTSRSATWCCRWSRSPRRRPTCSEPLRVFELDFEANLPIVRSCVQLPQAPGVPVDVRGLRHVPRRRVRPGALRARARPDQQAALDLLVREAADGPRDPGATAWRQGLDFTLFRPFNWIGAGPRLDQHARRKAARA